MIPNKTNFVILCLLFFTTLSCSNSNTTIYGNWVFKPKEGTDIVLWRYRQQELEITNNQGKLSILHNFIYRKKVAYIDSMIFTPGGEPNISTQNTQNWAGNWYMGVLAKMNGEKKVSGKWQKPDKVLQVEREDDLQTSQGEMRLSSSLEYRVEGDKLIVTEKRATRPTPVKLVFEKKA